MSGRDVSAAAAREAAALAARRAAAGIGGVKLAIIGLLALVVALVVFLGFSVVVFFTTATGGGVDTANVTCQAPGDGQAPPPPATGSIAEQQIANAKLIDQAARQAGLSGQASRIAIIAAVGESDLINVNYGDTAGPDSRGLFQQRTGWGTLAQRMNPIYAATSFLLGPRHDGLPHGPGGTGLVAIPGWEQMTPSAAIHEVQVNADPNHYTAYIDRAAAIATQAGVDFSRPGNRPDTPAGTNPAAPAENCGGAAAVPIGTGPCPLDAAQAPGKTSPSDCTKALTYMHDQMTSGATQWYRRCLGLVALAYGWNVSGVSTAYEHALIVKQAGQLHADTTNIPRGALMWWDGHPVGNAAGHVAIYDGEGFIYTNDATGPGKVGRVAWTVPTEQWGQTFMGWSAPYFPNAG
jgi:hypothetical protein